MGLDRLGPGDPAPRPLDRRRPVVEAAAGPADHAVRALRRPRARPVAVRRPGRRHRRRRHGLPRRAAPRRRAGRRRRGRRLRGRAVDRCATPRWATPRACSSRSGWPRSTATSPGARARPSLFGIGAALLRPEAWPFLGLYGLWLLWRDRRARAGYVAAGLRRAARCCGCCPSCGARATCCAPRTGRTTRAPTARPSPTTRSREVAPPVRRRCSRPALWTGLAALVVMMVAAPGLGPPRARVARRRPRAGRRASGSPRSPCMTNDGFSGNARYLIMPAAVACVLGRRRASAGSSGPCPRAGSRAALAVGGAVRRGRGRLRRAERRPPRRRPRVGLLPGAPHRRPRAAPSTQAGGPTACRRCGTPYTGAVPGARRGLAAATCTRRPCVGQRAGRRAAAVPAVVLRSRTTSGSHPVPALESIGGEAGRADVRDRRRLAHRGALRVSADGADASRARGRGIARLGTARLAVSLPKSLLVLAFLVGLSLALRTQAIHARFWIDEGLSVGISSHPLRRHPRRPAPGRLAAAVLPAAQAVDERLRQRRGATRTRCRWPSRCCTVPAAWLGGRALFGDRAGLDRRACWRRSTRS